MSPALPVDRRHRAGPALLFLLILLSLAGPVAAQSRDLFGTREAPPPSTTSPAFTPPGFVQRAVTTIGVWQRSLNKRLNEEIAAYKRHGSLTPVLVILMISFLYGLFHAVGPGHGKFIVTGYFLANRARPMHGVAMSGLIALVQALTAIAIVGGAAAILDISSFVLVKNVVWIELASYALILLLGLWIVWGGIVGRGCSHGHAPGHDHDTGDGNAHGHDHGPGHDHASPKPVTSYRAMVPAAVAAGLRPCTGSILVLLFTLAQGIFFVGVLGSLVMALGVALTVSAIGLTTIYVRRGIAQVANPGVRAANIAHRATGIVGGALILFFAGLLCLAAAQRVGLPV
ncbi:MAG: hypothetical protein RLT05_10980 [Bauldia litoralis]